MSPYFALDFPDPVGSAGPRFGRESPNRSISRWNPGQRGRPLCYRAVCPPLAARMKYWNSSSTTTMPARQSSPIAAAIEGKSSTFECRSLAARMSLCSSATLNVETTRARRRSVGTARAENRSGRRVGEIASTAAGFEAGAAYLLPMGRKAQSCARPSRSATTGAASGRGACRSAAWPWLHASAAFATRIRHTPTISQQEPR